MKKLVILFILFALIPINKVKAAEPKFMYWPVPSNHEITCDIGCYTGHKGIDIGVSTNYDTPIYAVADAYVETIVNDQPYGTDRVISSPNGNYVKLKHNISGTNYFTYYLHLTKNIPVTVGSNIKAGTLIGYGANSGYTCGEEDTTTGGCLDLPGSYTHLHFQLNGSCGDNSCFLNPDKYWIRNSNGSVKDPSINTYNCGSTNVTIQDASLENIDCTALNQILILPNTTIGPNSILHIK